MIFIKIKASRMFKTYVYLKSLLLLIALNYAAFVSAADIEIQSPNGKVGAVLTSEEGHWFLKVEYRDSEGSTQLTKVSLGLSRSDQDFLGDLKLLKAGKPVQVKEDYTALHGKRTKRQNFGTEQVFSFENPSKAKLNVIVRAYNDGVVFRYEFPEKSGKYTVKDEYTTFAVQDSTLRWLQKFDLSNENLYALIKDGSVQRDWSYPALFKDKDKETWFLIHEADLDRGYAGTKLVNITDGNGFKVALPLDHEGEGDALPVIELPWKSPWRVIILGDLGTIVESTLVEDVSKPSVIKNTDWIKPGKVSWNYWSDNHGTRDYQTVKKFTDLAADMDWPYTLFDWEWDVMQNGGNVEDAAKYAISKGVKPLIWYNSSMFKWITATPVDRMKTHENRVEEFTRLKSLGFVGVKVDFFLSEKQYMIDYYLDILEDAAKFEMMVNFHGSLVPRGWARTYPHLMTMEAVRGAEWYNNGPEFTYAAPEHNSVMPFTRNVVGSMDYTPTTFTNSQFPHITSYGHELALSVVFESALQHMADRPEGYENLPGAARDFLRDLPAAWDDIRFLSGYPGKDVNLVRRKGADWFVGGINSEFRAKSVTVDFSFLAEGQDYKLTLISDGKHDKAFDVYHQVVKNTDSLEVRMLPRGGYVISLKPLF